MAKKPAGTLGVNRVDMGPDGTPSHTFERFPFPSEKEAIEVMMARDFIESMHRQMASFGVPWIMSDPWQNSQDDFDFTISLPNNRTASLELMEIAPLELFGGYNGVPPDYKPYDLAQVINAMIMKKAVKYSGQLGQELHLLTYITH